MKLLRISKPLHALALILVLASAGCHKSSVGHSSQGPAVLFETEINDTAPEANFIGFVRPGDSFVIEGDMGFGGDYQDGFAFVAEVPVEIEYVLSVFDPSGLFGVCVYDPYFDQVVFCDTSGFNPEVGAFFVDAFDEDFHIFLTQLAGVGDYSLSINVFPLGPVLQANSDGNPPSAAGAHLAPATYADSEPRAIQHDEALLERAQSYRVERNVRAEPADRRLYPIGQLVIVEGNVVTTLPIVK